MRGYSGIEPVLIAGGGIAGLAAALALARRGIASRVLEAREAFSQSGAGIQIGPNGVRVLEHLGVAGFLAAKASRPDAITVRNALNARLLAELPLGDWIETRHGAPYWVAHRRDLQASLLAAIAAEPAIVVETGFMVQAVAERRDGVLVRSASGQERTGSTLLIADGLQSSLRRLVSPGLVPVAAGKAAYRTVVRSEAARGALAAPAMGVWLAPGAHVVHYGVEKGASVAVVAIVPETHATTGWSAPASWSELEPHLARFSSDLVQPLAAAGDWRRWSLASAPAPQRLASGHLALIGDAGHPMLPFLAQGGVMALEDAVVVAGQLARVNESTAVPAALAAYEAQRLDRVARVMREARRNGRIYHLAWPLAVARELAMRLLGPERLMTRYDWLYSWRPPAS